MRKKVVKYTCPSCGGSAKKLYLNRYRCKYCGNEFEIKEVDDGEEIKKALIYPNKHMPQTSSPSHTPPQYSQPNLTPASSKIGGYIAVGLVIFFVIIIGIANLSYKSKKSSKTNTSNNYHVQQDKKVEYYDLPEHERGKQIASLIFNKPFSEITKEDLAKVRYLKMDSSFDSNTLEDIDKIEYSFENYEDYPDYADFEKTIQTVEIYESNLEKDESDLDFTCYKNLTFIDAGSYDKDVYAGLPQLSGISVSESRFDSIIKTLNLGKIKYLDLYTGPYSNFDYSQIGKFNNLEKLDIRAYSMTEVPNALKSMKNLRSLSITGGDKIKSFDVIRDLKGLVNLKLTGVKELKDLSIISDLPLTTLWLEGSAINSYDVLKNNSTIKNLTLHFNSEVNDITPVSTMSSLEEFNTIVYTIGGMDSLSKLKNLKKLSLSTNGDTSINFISELDSLEELNLQCCYLQDGFGFLTSLPNLKKLNIASMVSSNSYKELANCNSLEELTIKSGQNDSVYLEDLMACSHIKTLNIKGGYVAFDFNSDYTDSGIENLFIKDIVISDLNWADVNPSEVVNIVSEMKTLKKLGLVHLKIDNIDALSPLSDLEELDVSQNYIGNFDVITKLPRLSVAKIYNNVLDKCPDYKGIIYNLASHITRQE